MSTLSPDFYTWLITNALNDLDLPRAQKIWKQMHDQHPLQADRVAKLAWQAGERALIKQMHD